MPRPSEARRKASGPTFPEAVRLGRARFHEKSSWGGEARVTGRRGWRAPTASGPTGQDIEPVELELRPEVLHGRRFVPDGCELAQRLEVP